MRSTASTQSKWQSTTIFMAVLLGAAVVIASLASGCNNDITAYECPDPDAGASDGGDAGGGGAGGYDSLCK